MADVRWLDATEQRAWRGYLRTYALLMGRLHRQLQADAGLSLADFEVLVRLTDVPDGRLRVFELAGQLQWEQSRLSHQLTRMERRGLVLRQECPEDGRGAFAVLTAAGRRAIEAAAPGHVETVRRLFFDPLRDGDVAALADLTDRVRRRLESDVERSERGSPGRGGASDAACPPHGAG